MLKDSGAGEYHEVFLREGLQDPAIDITSSFTLADGTPPTKDRLHANIDLPLGTHEVWVVQHKGANSWQSAKRQFSLVTGLATEYGALTGLEGGTAGKVVTQAIGGAVERPAPASDLALLFGETDLNGGTVHPSTIAFSTDTDPTDGITTSYYDEAGIGTIEAALGPLVAGETEIELVAPFVDGSDIYAFYWRTHTTGPREVGLAKMSGGTPPFVRQTFPNTSTLFGDTYSLFEDGDLQPASGGVVSGSDLYLYGLQLPGGATSHEVYSARVPLNAVTQASSYEYWTTSGWQSAPATPVALWDNSGAPSVAYNTQEARWVAVHGVEQRLILPYVQDESHSALAVRVAENLEGPWSEPVVVWERPQTLLTGTGSVHHPVILPGVESLSKITVAANDGGEWTRPENAYLYEIDLSQLTFPPALDLPSDPTMQNPHPAAGFASSGDLVRIFVNGEEQGSDTAQADGSFEIPIVLVDGPNSVYAVADSGGQTSDPSAVVTYNYENAESRAVSGSITTDTVWTPGQAPGITGPYIIGSNLTIDPTATLTIQPGVEMRVDGLFSITVDGGLVVQGTAGQRVVLRSDAAIPGYQDWIGLTVNGQAVLDEVDISNTSTAIRVAGGDLQLSNAAITQFVNGVQFQAGGTGHLGVGTVIDNAAGWPIGSCIELTDAGIVTIDSVQSYRCRYGLTLIRSSPDVQASTFSDHEYHGMWIKDGSNPDIHGGNAITDNDITGVRVEKGPGGQAVDPAPIVRESDLFGNSTYDYYSASVGPPLQASGNWWGTADPVAIAANIRDSSDSVFAANVQWTPFLNASSTAGGTAVPGSYLNGPVVGAVQAGVTHMVVGDLLVESGQVATLEAGAHLQFLPGMRFLVDGTLDIAGSASQLVHLESAESVPAPGDWDGIYISASSVNSQIRHALIEHGEYGVNIDQATVDVSDSQVRDASAAGIYLSDSSSQLLNNVLTFPSPSTPLNSGIYVVEPAGGAAIPDLIGNTIQDYRYGIRIRHASTQAGTGVVSVTGNTLEAAKNYGLYVEGTASPLVTGNLIRNNTAIGIVLVAVSGGYPTPTIQGNDIHDNGASPQSDLSAGASSLVDSVDASKNWWGTTDPVEIADKIKDRTDTANRPVVGFTKFLDGSILANGQEVQGNYVTGPLVPGTTFSSGTTYVVTGVIDVPVGGMLTVESGATLSFLPNTRLEVAGTLDAQGGLFTSANTVPGQNDWEGIQILPGSTGSVLDGIIVEWAKDSVEVDGADADITNSTFREFGLGGITYRNSATGTISNNTVHQGQQNARGIEIVDSSPTVTSNTVSGIGTGIDLTDASPLITGNTIDGNKTGISIHRGSSPTISGLNLIQNNTTLGVLIQGNGSQVDDPAPVLTGNDIKDNGPNAPTAPLNLKANTFGNTAVNLDAKLNYWGTDVETEVLAGIDTSSASSPSVDSIPYLKADGTPSGSSNLLNETLTSDLTLPLGTTWSLVGDLTVPLGWTLTIEPGVTIKASPGTAIDVSGTLDLQGTSGNRIRLESAETVPTSGSWEGIFLLSGSSGSVIAYADILHARHGVDVNGAIGTVSISETDFIDFGRGLPYVPGAGIRVENALAAITNNNFTHSLGSSTSGIYGIQMVGALAGSTITGNLIRDLDHGIHLESNSDPAIQGNTIQLNSRGIHVTGASSPVIDGANVITLNDYGIYIVSPGASSPTISGNDILENDTGSGSPLYNVFAASGGSHEIEAGNNWWGVQTASEVAAGILDATDGGSSRPYVDAVPFLDASVSMGGVPVTTSNFLGGFFPTGVSSLTADTSYEAVGSLVVPVGATLTIPEGATISMTDDASFLVEGILQVAGVSGNRVTFSHPTATAGSWAGIVFESTSVGSTLNEVLIQDAQRAVWVRDVDVAITEAEITNFGETGIWIDGSWTSGPTVGTITGSWIHNSNLSGTGIYLTSSQFGEGASPAITNTRVEGTFVGIHMAGKSSPHITASTITGNRTGIQLFGQHNVDRIPAPVVNDSNIFDNVFSGPIVRNLEVKGYFYEGTSQVLDFKRNWWGSTSLAAIQATIEAPADPQAPVIDLSDLLNAENGASIPGPIFTQLVHTVTRSVDGFRPLEVEDVTVDFVLAAPAASVDVNFYEGTGFNLGPLRRTIHITGAAAGPNFVVWDGKDDSGGYVASDGYTYTIDADGFLYAPGPWFVGGPPVAPGVQWADSGDPGYNTYRNEFWHRDLEVTGHAAEITLRIKRAPNDFFDPWPRSRVVPPGTHTLVWDGRDDSGIPVEGGPREIASNSNSPLRYNLVVVEGTAPLITGTSPHIEVKADPWLVTHSYEQISKLTYRLDQDSHVTIKVLPPGIYDPDDPSPEIQTLVDNVLQPAESGGNPVDYVVPWTGLDPADTDGDAGNNVRVDSDGHHTFTIEATSDVTGFSTVYRGSLQIQR